jgi:hypothetical protein
MTRRRVLLSVLLTLASFASVATAAGAYKYKCPRNGLIFSYNQPGSYKCPVHGGYHLVAVN